MADTMVSSLMNMTGANLPRGDFFELVKVSSQLIIIITMTTYPR